MSGADVKAQVMEALATKDGDYRWLADPRRAEASDALSTCVVLTAAEAAKVSLRVRAGFGCRSTPLQPGDEAERDYYAALALLTPGKETT